MQREMMNKLVNWKSSLARKPLIIRGARQVGKTWLMKEFGRQYFKNTVYINFDENRNIIKLFDGNINPERILLGLNAETGETIVPEDTLIIFDEIQEAPRALTSLKFFCEEAPEYAIVSASSLLGVALHEGTLFPVGKVILYDLYPMSFKEFLCALGEEKQAYLIENDDKELTAAFKNKYIERLKQYYYVGGMPEAVKLFAEGADYSKVREVQKDLLNYYQQDFSKHANPALIPRLNLIWQLIPSQLAKENRKFIYGLIREGSRAKDYELALQWLQDCGLIHKNKCVKKPGIPLNAYAESSIFKIFLLDVGLLGAMAELPAKTILEGDSIFTEFKGALTEQYVIEQLVGTGNNIYYFSEDNSRCEIDVLYLNGRSIIPVEVKAEENLRAKSLRTYYEKYKPQISVRTSMSDYREQDWMINIPLYRISEIDRIILPYSAM